MGVLDKTRTPRVLRRGREREGRVRLRAVRTARRTTPYQRRMNAQTPKKGETAEDPRLQTPKTGDTAEDPRLQRSVQPKLARWFSPQPTGTDLELVEVQKVGSRWLKVCCHLN